MAKKQKKSKTGTRFKHDRVRVNLPKIVLKELTRKLGNEISSGFIGPAFRYRTNLKFILSS